MPDSTPPSPEPTGPAALRSLLERQHALVEELSGLAGRQAALVREGRAEALLGLLTERQRIIDRFIATQDELRRLTEDLPAGAGEIDAAGRAELRGLVEAIGARLGEVMARDEQDQKALEGQRERIRVELAGVDASRQARDAYRRARIAGSRFADRKG